MFLKTGRLLLHAFSSSWLQQTCCLSLGASQRSLALFSLHPPINSCIINKDSLIRPRSASPRTSHPPALTILVATTRPSPAPQRAPPLDATSRCEVPGRIPCKTPPRASLHFISELLTSDLSPIFPLPLYPRCILSKILFPSSLVGTSRQAIARQHWQGKT